MNIEVISVDEETGHVELELDEEARAWLIEVGFNKILRDAIEAIDEGAGDPVMDMVADFERRCESMDCYGDVDVARVKKFLDAGDAQGAAEEMTSAMSGSDGSEASDMAFDVAMELVDDYMAEHGDMGAAMARYESVGSPDATAAAEGTVGRKMSIQILKETVEAKTRRLSARWTFEAAQDAEELGYDPEDVEDYLDSKFGESINDMRKLAGLGESDTDDEEARAWLIEVGFNKILRDAIEAIDERNN